MQVDIRSIATATFGQFIAKGHKIGKKGKKGEKGERGEKEKRGKEEKKKRKKGEKERRKKGERKINRSIIQTMDHLNKLRHYIISIDRQGHN